MVTISENTQKIAWLWQERDRLHQSVSCSADTLHLHLGLRTTPSPSRSWCPCSCWGEWSGIDLIFIDAKVKINDAYYREVLLTQKLLPVMHEICGEFLPSSKGKAYIPTHQARGTINFLKQDTCVHFARYLATQQHKSEPDWLQNMGRNAAAGLANSWHWWTEASLDRCLASFQAKRRWWRSWWVA